MKAIVNSGNRKLIGEVGIPIDRKQEDGQRPRPGEVAIMMDTLELRSDMFLLPTPNGPVGIHKTTVVPIDAEEDPVDIEVHIDNIRWFEDMPDKGQKYENMVAEFKQQMIQNRANKAGLTMATNLPPKGPGLIK